MHTGIKRLVFIITFFMSFEVSLLLSGEKETSRQDWAVRSLANDYVVVIESPFPDSVFAFSPGIVRLPNGRIIATMDFGGKGRNQIPNIKRDGWEWRGRILASDDRGKTWQIKAESPMNHARPFVAGSSVYVLGKQGPLVIMKSDDMGQTWSKPHKLTKIGGWHQAPCNVLYANEKVYLVMERKKDPDYQGWPVAVLAPVVMSAPIAADLTKQESWTYSNELCYQDLTKQHGEPNQFGIPFFKIGPTNPKAFGTGDVRHMRNPGWLETNIVQFSDPDHVWFDPEGKTFYLWARSHTGTSNLACIAKVTEDKQGKLEVSAATAPSGKPMLFVPCPGGQMKFHILYDEKSKLFWLLSSQSTDSMTHPNRLPDNRYNLPNNERHRLVLHFSKNCVDWCFAGLVCDSGVSGQDRHYASMAFDGDDLLILSRSGDERAKRSHDGNLITFHVVKDFRKLSY